MFSDHLLLTAVFALVVGAVMGLFGGGGSVLSVPLLLYVTKLEAHAAIAVSLFMVAVSSALGAVVHARGGHVRVRSSIMFAMAATVFAFAGGVVARHLSARLLLSVFSALMLVTAFRMLRRDTAGERPATSPAALRLVLVGSVAGFVAGLVGAGGGFMVVPALIFFAGLDMREAVGTSLFVIAFSSFAGFLGHALDVQLDPLVLAATTVPSLIGVVLGAVFGRRLPSRHLRMGFGLLILGLGLFLLFEQLRVVLDG